MDERDATKSMEPGRYESSSTTTEGQYSGPDYVLVPRYSLKWAISALESHIAAKSLECTTWFEPLKAALESGKSNESEN